MVLKSNRGRRIAISGSFSTGKSTLAKELAGQTGLSLIQPPPGPEIFRELFPGARLRDNTPSQILQVGMERLIERRALERRYAAEGFISDGTALTEWAYGVARKEHGYGSPELGRLFGGPEFGFAVDAFGDLVKRYVAARAYDLIIHLPIEYGMAGENPEHIDEAFRRRTDEVLTAALTSLDVPLVVVNGTHEERVRKVLEATKLVSSPTRNGVITNSGILLFADVDDALGPERKRFFSYGFRNVGHNIYEVQVDIPNSRITALVDVFFNGAWSTKAGCTRPDVHVSSIDMIRIAGQLVQVLMYLKDGITRDQSNNLWLREIEIKATKPVENLVGMPVEISLESQYHPPRDGSAGPLSHFATVTANMGNGAFLIKGKVCYKLPEGVDPRSAHQI